MQKTTHLDIKNHIKQQEIKSKKAIEGQKSIELLRQENKGEDIIISEPLPKSAFSPLRDGNQKSSFLPDLAHARNSALAEKRFDENYIPACQQLMLNGLYSYSGLTTGGNLCFYIPVEEGERIKLDAQILSQQAGEDNDIYLLKDDPDNPYTFPWQVESVRPGNADEHALMVSGAGHYYIFIESYQGTGASFLFGLNAYTQIDSQELNETMASAYVLSHAETLSGNIDSALDVDYIEYNVIGSNLVLEVSQNANVHDLQISFDGLTWQSLSGNGVLDLGASFGIAPNSKVWFWVSRNDTLDPAQTYTIRIFDDQNKKVASLVGLVERSVDPYGVLRDQMIPGYSYNLSPIRGGVSGSNSSFRIFAQINLIDGSPARRRNVVLDWTISTPLIGGVYNERTVRTDENGYIEEYIPLYACRGYKTHLQKVPGLNPNLWFKFDVETYHIKADTPNGFKNLITSHEHFFNICEVREEGPTGLRLNPYTYE